MKKQIITIALIAIGVCAAAQKKVAVFDPAGDVSTSIKNVVREEIITSIVNSGEFTVVERALINKVLEENKFQSGGLVDDSQISDMGKRMGADYVFVSSITPMNSGGSVKYHISLKFIDVLTARIEKQQTARSSGDADIVDVIIGKTASMFGGMQAAASQTLPASLKGAILMAEGRNVYRSGTKLTPPEVLSIMDGNDALQTYAAGLRQWKSGRNVQIVGAILGIVGAAGAIYGGYSMASAEWPYDYNDRNSAEFKEKEKEYESKMNKGTTALAIGIPLTLAGGMVMQIVGGVKKSRGSRKIAQSVDAYNNSRRSVSRVEWDFGVTQQGLLGFVIKF